MKEKLTRRQFLRLGAGAGASAILAACKGVTTARNESGWDLCWGNIIKIGGKKELLDGTTIAVQREGESGVRVTVNDDEENSVLFENDEGEVEIDGKEAVVLKEGNVCFPNQAKGEE